MKTTYKAMILPVMLDLYDRLAPTLRDELNPFIDQVTAGLTNDCYDVTHGPLCVQHDEVRQVCKQAQEQGVDLLIVAHLSYSPSGEILPGLMESNLPLLLWPIQPMATLDCDRYDRHTMLLNHGMHGTQDLANMLRRQGRDHGILHGHWEDEQTREELCDWIRAGRVLQTMRGANPLVLGGRFDGMLDLQLDHEVFLAEQNIRAKTIALADYVALLNTVDSAEARSLLKNYENDFAIDDDCTAELLTQAARQELALRQLMQREQSRAIGINFLQLCNHPEIGDALHVAASRLMNEGYGYGAEGDWCTATIGSGFSAAGCVASFTEMFSVGYEDARIVLRHWGEGNYACSRSKANLLGSRCADSREAHFAVVDFEFKSGPVMLVNFNTTPDSQGQLISMCGEITEDILPQVDGPRGVFRPDGGDTAELLTGYAYSGGSHHLTMLYGDESRLLNCLSVLAGWVHLSE